jgi:GntR family transcriptional regulator
MTSLCHYARMKVNPSEALPLYAQVETALAARIGTLRPGICLPSEEKLMEEFGVSRTTIRTTIQNLLRRGLIEIRRGKGTFVTEPKIIQNLTALTGFVEDMRELGRHATARVLDRQIVVAPESAARQLMLPPNTKVVRIQRVRLADSVPLSFDETYLPFDLGQKIMADDLATEPIFSLLEQKYNTPLLEAEYRLEAAIAEPTEALALGVSPGNPIFLIERTSYTQAHRPVDYERLFYRGDRIRFVTRLSRRSSPA